jgi:hypothetical protein
VNHPVQHTTNTIADALPILHAAHPVWYRGRLRAVVADDSVYSVGWVEPRERPVIRAMALATVEAPYFTPDQQLSFAAYYLLPEERWADLRAMPDEIIALRTGLPLDVVQRRRTLPSVDITTIEPEAETACA